jgi:hypothetical protein
MTKFSAEQCRALAVMVGINLKHMRENVALRTILMTCAHNNTSPGKWEQSLDELMKTPVFTVLGKDLESWISVLQETAEEIDVADLLAKFPASYPKN